ncbi:MAG TPA: hypothetical protein PKA53_06160 [Sphingobacterium sp.]|nr:hypothetical protein [Sphingobacterium sp.]
MGRYQAIVITPVKNSLANTMATIKAIKKSLGSFLYLVYDDFSDEYVSEALKNNADKLDYNYIHLSKLTDTPSPNYITVLLDAQQKAVENRLPLIIVESDIEVEYDTFQRLLSFCEHNTAVGMVGAITVDYKKEINFPYLKFKDKKKEPIMTDRSLSFCCTLLTKEFLEKFNFKNLQKGKDWYDTSISYASLEHGFKNYVLLDTPVLHKPHGSRPWKQLKYTNPIKYYWLKFIKGRDKI